METVTDEDRSMTDIGCVSFLFSNQDLLQSAPALVLFTDSYLMTQGCMSPTLLRAEMAPVRFPNSSRDKLH